MPEPRQAIQPVGRPVNLSTSHKSSQTRRMTFERILHVIQSSFAQVWPDFSAGGRDRAPDHQDERNQVNDHDHDGDREQSVRWEGGPGAHYQAGAQDRVDESNRMLDDPRINDPVNAQSDA